jgi:hypothetical protein
MWVSQCACRRGIRYSLRDGFVMALLVVYPPLGIADDGKTAADNPNDGAEGILQSHLEALRFTAPETEDDETLEVAPQALLKYNDPARRYLAGGVWRIGKSGRPKGLVVLELWPDDADPHRGRLHHELSSFQTGGLELTSSFGIGWHARGSVLEFKPLSDAPRPARTAERRLLQMKELARGFAVKESYQGDVSVLRLLPRPIDRYEDRKTGIDDGAMFAFAYGTNPELVLLLECHAEEWQFAMARLSWAKLNVERGGALQQVFSEMNAAGPNDAYTPKTVSVLLPPPR